MRVLTKGGVDALTLLANHETLGEDLLDMESRRQNQRIDLLLRPILQLQSLTLDADNGLGMDTHVLARQGWIVVGRDHNATAAHIVGRRQLLSQNLVADLDVPEKPGHQSHELARDQVLQLG